ncbi:histidinol dehydrogenase [Moorella thermoacetica Y72]|uniref:Histidinol dehydrogenase n=1 Tax=Moorella thermoacetica Y72 TaxID=1325331 RepID=A0A0S6UDC2_NEOTH|nr:histidinol dehydrogenase [Moorella thermoacetica Y72]
MSSGHLYSPPNINSKYSQQFLHLHQGQADDIEIIALNPGHQQGPATLDAVGASFIQGFAGGYISFDLVRRQVTKGHRGPGVGNPFRTPGGLDDRHPGIDGMGAPAQEGQHPGGSSGGIRFAQNLPLAHHQRISPQDQGVSETGGHRPGLSQGQGFYPGRRGQMPVNALINPAGLDGEG